MCKLGNGMRDSSCSTSAVPTGLVYRCRQKQRQFACTRLHHYGWHVRLQGYGLVSSMNSCPLVGDTCLSLFAS